MLFIRLRRSRRGGAPPGIDEMWMRSEPCWPETVRRYVGGHKAKSAPPPPISSKSVCRGPARSESAEKEPPCMRVVRQRRESSRKEHWFSFFCPRRLPRRARVEPQGVFRISVLARVNLRLPALPTGCKSPPSALYYLRNSFTTSNEENRADGRQEV